MKNKLIKNVFEVLLFVDQKHGPWGEKKRIINAFETWCLKRMLEVKWTDRIKKDVVFQRDKEER